MASFDDGASLADVRQMLNDTGLRKNTYGAERAPNASDDETRGYEQGSRWMHGDQEWVAASVAAGQASWLLNATADSGTTPDLTTIYNEAKA